LPTKKEIEAFVLKHMDEYYDFKEGMYKVEELAIEASHHFEESLSLGDEPLDQYIQVIEEMGL
jgi:hypothetical protein